MVTHRLVNCILALGVVSAALFGLFAVTGHFAAPRPARICVYPPDLGLSVGAHQRFRVVAFDSRGSAVPLFRQVCWESDGKAGTITADGHFIADGEPGAVGHITAVTPDGLSATATVTLFPRRSHD